MVVLTTSKDEEDVLRSYNLGANSFITKPVTFDGLVEVVKSLGKYWFEIVELPGGDTGQIKERGEEHEEPAGEGPPYRR